jgi:hypothetical protein
MQPFILTTDPSKIIVAEILPQVQNAIERSVAYTTRQLNKPEQAFSVSEAELLAVISAAIYFGCYLYGKRFKVRAYNAALTYLKSYPDTYAKLMR